jgi:hypothetical protein
MTVLFEGRGGVALAACSVFSEVLLEPFMSCFGVWLKSNSGSCGAFWRVWY